MATAGVCGANYIAIRGRGCRQRLLDAPVDGSRSLPCKRTGWGMETVAGSQERKLRARNLLDPRDTRCTSQLQKLVRGICSTRMSVLARSDRFGQQQW